MTTNNRLLEFSLELNKESLSPTKFRNFLLLFNFVDSSESGLADLLCWTSNLDLVRVSVISTFYDDRNLTI